VDYRAISPGFFQTMGIKVLAGRDFKDSDVAGTAAVVIVNQAAARECWKGENPVGTQFWTWGVSVNKSPLLVVGLVNDVREYSLGEPAPPVIYVPQAQASESLNRLLYQSFGLLSAIVIRATDTPDLSANVRRAVESTDPAQPVVSVAPMSELIGQSAALARMLMLLMGTFAALALLLTAVGLYGMLSYHVARRTREIGIRIALGARAQQVLRLVVGEGLVLVISGGVVGFAGALLATRLLKTVIFGVTPSDPVTFILVALFLLCVTTAASYVPARRAARIDPVQALRCE